MRRRLASEGWRMADGGSELSPIPNNPRTPGVGPEVRADLGKHDAPMVALWPTMAHYGPSAVEA